MTKIIAITNHKGGVGKTTTTANLGAALALLGKRVLLIDCDSQQNLTSSLMDESKVEQSIYDSMRDGATLPIVPISENLDLIPADENLAFADMELTKKANAQQLLKNLLSKVSNKYDHILIDCPPSLGIITLNALTSATDLYLPLTGEALPLRGLTMLEKAVASVANTTNPNIRISGVIITRFNGRKLNKAVKSAIGGKYGDRLFDTAIRENIALAEAPAYHQSVFSYAPNSNGAADYMALANEVIKK